MCSRRGEEEANGGSERLPIKNVRSSRIKEFGGREVPSSEGERKDRKRVWDWWQRDSGARVKAWLSARGGASGLSSREDAAGKDETAGDG